MKHRPVLLAVLLVLGGLIAPPLHGGGRQTAAASGTREVERAIAASWEALSRQDFTAFTAGVSPDWELFTAMGNRFDAQKLFAVHNAGLSGFKLEMSGVRVSTGGDLAWAKYDATMTGTSGGKPWGGRFVITSILQKRGGAWIRVHTHESKKAG